MKVVLLSGSPRREGNTVLALKEVIKGIESMGVETELLTLAGKDIRGCIACNACIKLGRCVFDDGLNDMVEKIRSAEGFIIGSPVYFGTARGDVMNFLQRLGMQHKKNGNFLDGKIGGPVAVARRGGHTASLQEMQMFFQICNMTVPGSVYWNMAFGLQEGDVLNDEEGMNTLFTFGKNVGTLVQKIYG